MPKYRYTHMSVEERETLKTIVELDRMSSFETIGKELRLQNLYDIKSDLFLARMIVGVNEVTRNATVVLRRDPNTGTGAVLYYRSSNTYPSDPAPAPNETSGRPGQRLISLPGRTAHSGTAGAESRHLGDERDRIRE